MLKMLSGNTHPAVIEPGRFGAPRYPPYFYYDGIAEIPEEQIADALEGKWPSVIRGNNTPRFETGHENYLWLNKLKAVGTGEARLVGDHLEVCYSVYALR
jgi:hypothetical protein